MKLDSADLTLASGQVITVLDLTILCEKTPPSSLRAPFDGEAAPSAQRWESTPSLEPSPASRLSIQGRTAASLHVGEEICLEGMDAQLPANGGVVLGPTRVFVQSIEPLHDSPVPFSNFKAASQGLAG